MILYIFDLMLRLFMAPLFIFGFIFDLIEQLFGEFMAIILIGFLVLSLITLGVVWFAQFFGESMCLDVGETMGLQTHYTSFHCFVTEDGKTIPLSNYRID
ncbi:hypothetical protein CWC29_007365 [Pseudoalteromonas sp. S4498]|uniref:hypothetical protein n=1 Tax=Pseudoalteromonas galatheae TaxID=579562 RepID=UPI00110841D7|nr:hypothetical protein [Pseudoalteromonas galatheae]NKC18663.1 hypothetical protein [Pseudoalteromonas galatheae]